MPVLESLRNKFGSELLHAQVYRGQETAVVRREIFLDLARWLRDDAGNDCDVLMDLTAVDYLKFGKSRSNAPTLTTPSPLPYFMKPKDVAERWERGVSNDAFRYDVAYHFYSTRHNHRVRVRVPVAAADAWMPTLTGLWASADWLEREAWDMYGIRFDGHPNLKRILMYEEFVGHPLRKDYPINKRQPLVKGAE